MLILAGIAFVVSALFGWIVIGTAVAFLCSKPKGIVSVTRLGKISLAVFVLQDIVDWLWFAPLELTITTNNETLIRLFGSNELISSLTDSSFSISDVLTYAIQVGVATLCGRYLVGKYYREHYRTEASEDTAENNLKAEKI